MKRLAETPDRAAQRTQGKAQQADPAGAMGLQSPDPVAAEHAFGHAEDIRGRDPVAARHSSITDHEKPICSFIVKNKPMQYQSSVNLVQYNASTMERVGWQRMDDNALSVADGRMHAESERVEGDGRALLKKGGDDFLSLGHDGDQS